MGALSFWQAFLYWQRISNCCVAIACKKENAAGTALSKLASNALANSREGHFRGSCYWCTTWCSRSTSLLKACI